jgi:hypothetical protein
VAPSTVSEHLARLVAAGLVTVRPEGRSKFYRLTPRGETALGVIGVDLAAVPARRPAVRYCLDWSEQRHHLAGPLGTALAGRLFALGWGDPHAVAPGGPGHRGRPGEPARGARPAARPDQPAAGRPAC